MNGYFQYSDGTVLWTVTDNYGDRPYTQAGGRKLTAAENYYGMLQWAWPLLAEVSANVYICYP